MVTVLSCVVVLMVGDRNSRKLAVQKQLLVFGFLGILVTSGAFRGIHPDIGIGNNARNKKR